MTKKYNSLYIFAQYNVVSNDDGVRIQSPYMNCLNEKRLHITQIRDHLIYIDFLWKYTTWTWYGELLNLLCVCQSDKFVDSTMKDGLEDMILNVRTKSFAQTHSYENIFNDVETLLYHDSTNFTFVIGVKVDEFEGSQQVDW